MKLMYSQFDEEMRAIRGCLRQLQQARNPDVLQVGNTWVAEFAEAGAFLTSLNAEDKYPNLNPDNFFESTTATTIYDTKKRIRNFHTSLILAYCSIVRFTC